MDSGRSNVEVVRRVYALVADYLGGRGDGIEQAIPSLRSPELVLTPSSALSSGSIGPYRGLDGFMQWLNGVREQWASFEMQADDYVESRPDAVVMLGRNVASRPGEQGYAVAVGHVWRFRDGLVTAITAFESQARALEEVGFDRDELASRRAGQA
jgi:ketosteroid isomerase-like protein